MLRGRNGRRWMFRGRSREETFRPRRDSIVPAAKNAGNVSALACIQRKIIGYGAARQRSFRQREAEDAPTSRRSVFASSRCAGDPVFLRHLFRARTDRRMARVRRARNAQARLRAGARPRVPRAGDHEGSARPRRRLRRVYGDAHRSQPHGQRRPRHAFRAAARCKRRCRIARPRSRPAMPSW